MIPPYEPPPDPARIAWVPPGCGYAAWVILTCQGDDLTDTRIEETPLLEGVSDILLTTGPAGIMTSALYRSEPPA